MDCARDGGKCQFRSARRRLPPSKKRITSMSRSIYPEWTRRAVSCAAIIGLSPCSASPNGNPRDIGGTNSAAASPAAATEDDAGPIAAIPQYPVRSDGAGKDALFSGNILIEKSCIYVVSDGIRVLPIFPEGSVEWIEYGASFGYDGQAYSAGSAISIGGGEGRGGPALDRSVFSHPPGADSDTDELWMVSP